MRSFQKSVTKLRDFDHNLPPHSFFFMKVEMNRTTLAFS